MNYANAIVYLNAAGIVLLVIYSIFARGTLVSFNKKLDEAIISPSDFTVMVRDLPKDVN